MFFIFNFLNKFHLSLGRAAIHLSCLVPAISTSQPFCSLSLCSVFSGLIHLLGYSGCFWKHPTGHGDQSQEPPQRRPELIRSAIWPSIFAFGLFLPTAWARPARSLGTTPWAVVQLRPGCTRQQAACSSDSPRGARSHGRWKFRRVQLPAGGGGAAVE